MDDRTYRRMQLACSCGHVSRSMGEEARHRHNFPALCKKPKPDKAITVYVVIDQYSAKRGWRTFIHYDLIRSSDGKLVRANSQRYEQLYRQGRLVLL